MGYHHPSFQIGPAFSRDFQSIYADQKEALVGADHLAIRHLKRDDALADLRPGMVDHEARFFEQFPASGSRISFSGIERAARRGPESLPCKRTLLMLESEQK